MSTGYRTWVAAFLGLAAFLGGCNGAGQGSKAPVAGEEPAAGETHEGPYLTVDHAVHDFGEVEPGERVNCTFALTNSGTEPLRIQSVRKVCGCTVTKLAKYTLAPGESELLEVRLTVPSRASRTSKAITVLVAPPGKPLRVPLTLKAEVRPIIKVAPAPLTLELRGGEKVSGTVKLTSRKGEEFSVTGYRGQGDLQVSFEKDKRGESHELTVEGEVSKLAGRPAATLLIETDHPKKKTVPVQIKVVPPFSARPTIKTFLNMEAGESRKSSVTVFSNFGEGFEIGPEITSVHGYVKVSKVSKVNEQTYQVEFEMTVPADTKNPTLRDVLTIPIAGYPKCSVKVNCYARLK